MKPRRHSGRGRRLGYAMAMVLAAWGFSAHAQDEEGTTPGAIPNPGTYQGSMDLQRQSDQQDQQLRQQQQQQQPYQQPSYPPAYPAAPSGPEPSATQPPPDWRTEESTNPVADAGAAQGPQSAQSRAAYAALERGDWAGAVRLWRPLAEAGNADSAYNLGVMYDQGHGVATDKGVAMTWYRKAADQGMGVAMGNLALLYMRRAQYEQMAPAVSDAIEAYKWLTLAVAYMAPAQRAAPEQTRAQLATLLSPGQVGQAEALARAWKPVRSAGGTTRASAAEAAPARPASLRSGAPNASVRFQVGDAGPGYFRPLAAARLWMTTDDPGPALGGGAALDRLAADCREAGACVRDFKAMTTHAIGVYSTDSAGHAQTPDIPSGQYYVVGFAPMQGRTVLWARSIFVQPGPNVVTLDQTLGALTP
jgi:TPR repeat protein